MSSSRHRLVLRAVGSILSVARPFKARAFTSRASTHKPVPAAEPMAHSGRLPGPDAGVAIARTILERRRCGLAPSRHLSPCLLRPGHPSRLTTPVPQSRMQSQRLRQLADTSCKHPTTRALVTIFLIMGTYHWEAGERLPVWDNSWDEVVGDSILLKRISIAR